MELKGDTEHNAIHCNNAIPMANLKMKVESTPVYLHDSFLPGNAIIVNL